LVAEPRVLLFAREEPLTRDEPLFAGSDPLFTLHSHVFPLLLASTIPGTGRRGGLEPLLRAARRAEEQKRKRDADPGEGGGGEKGRLETLRQGDERTRVAVGGQVVVGPGDRHGGDDGGPEGGAHLERRVAEPGRESRLALRDARERRDGGGDEREADARAED